MTKSNKLPAFEDALTLIENEEPASRIQGLLLLEKIADKRSFRVANSLKEDSAQSVRFQAERICKTFIDKGIDITQDKKQQTIQAIKRISSGSDILKETISKILANLKNILPGYLGLNLIKIVAAIALIKLSINNQAQIPSLPMALICYLIFEAIFKSLLWHFTGNKIAASIPNYVNRSKTVAKLSLPQFTKLLKGSLFELIPIIAVTILLALPMKLALPAILLFIPLGTKLFYLSLTLLPLKVMSLRLWQTPLEKSLKLFLHSNNILSDFYRAGLFCWILSLIGFSSIIALGIKQLAGAFTFSTLLGSYLLAEVIVTPIWICYRLIATLLFVPDEESK
jgi:hypothetical protein